MRHRRRTDRERFAGAAFQRCAATTGFSMLPALAEH
jgi:hypothetical protein